MTSATAAARPARIASIDILRGAVMVLMAVDHVRVFSGVPAGGPSPGVFFTRWVTHFCAPVFVFLAGTSAFLSGRTRGDLSRHLLVRGLWLVVLEFTIVRVSWTFNFDYAHYLLAGVIWVIGCSMIALAVLVRLPLAVTGAFGVLMIAGHNLMDPRFGGWVQQLSTSNAGAIWKLLYLGFWAGPIRLGPSGPDLNVLYSWIPWVGVMAAGYAYGKVMTLEPSRRTRLCLALGLGATALFLVLRGFNLYGDPRPWSASPAPSSGPPSLPPLLSFLNTTKYPASLSFLLMTLGPALALMPALESARGALVRWLTVFGRVPFFYYLLHIPLIHALALIVCFARTGAVSPWLFANHPGSAGPPPEGYMWGLGLLYLVWAVAVVLLYFPCRRFAELKSTSRAAWTRYL